MKNFIFAFIALFALAFNSIADETAIPDPLKPWVPWVLTDFEYLDCPTINLAHYQDRQNHICAWPSALKLTANAQGAQFNQDWQVMSKSWLLLPGGKFNWPSEVRVNGKIQTVIERQGRPALQLDTGKYEITGKFTWPKLPESIQIPESYAYVDLTVNNKPVTFTRIEEGELWFSEAKVDKTEQDALSVEVQRLVEDQSYLQLTTLINLQVWGKKRDQVIGKVLPTGFSLIDISGDVSAFLDADGLLHAKLQPGEWTLEIKSYALPTQTNWQPPVATFAWPKQEAWAFSADEQFRVGKLKGGSIIDSAQADMPDNWQNFPTYIVSHDNPLNFEVNHRGQSLQSKTELQLNRKMWLSFDGSQFNFIDDIKGSAAAPERLSMLSPYLLESGKDIDGPVLITSQSDNERGIENRYHEVSIEGRGLIAQSSELPISGWDSRFEAIKVDLNLPPAYRLFAVFGADDSVGTWLDSWSIWNVFLLLFATILATRLAGLLLGGISTLLILLVFQEAHAPVMLMINLLLVMTARQYQLPEGVKKLLNGYLSISILALLIGSMFFAANQLRSALYPQLEERAYVSSGYYGFSDTSGGTYRSKNTEVFGMFDQGNQASQEDGLAERIEVRGSRIQSPGALKAKVQKRYQNDAIVQAGSGRPDWQWNSYQLNWHSPVAKGQDVSLIIVPPWLSRTLGILSVLLLIFWMILLFKDKLKQLAPKPSAQAMAIVGALLLLPAGSETAMASSFPDRQMLQALQQRLIEPPHCSPRCAVINHLDVSLSEKQLTLTMQVHSLDKTAIALPQSRFWRAQSVKINDKVHTTLFRNKGITYIPVNKGIYTMTLSGLIAPVEQWQLEFRELPKQVGLLEINGWDVIGVNQNRLNGNTLEFIAREQKTGEDKATRYAVKPFVEVNRELNFDNNWTITTTVYRIAPSRGSVTVEVPLLPGENVTTSDSQINQGKILVTINPGEQQTSWQSVLDKHEEITLTANEQLPGVEQWVISSSSSWHIEQSGLPVISDGNPSGYIDSQYYPYPGESLTLSIDRPDTVKGNVLAIDYVNSKINLGKRTSTYDLSFVYRATRGGEHSIDLPQGYQLKSVKMGEQQRELNLHAENGKLSLPISPGQHPLFIELQSDTTLANYWSTPQINLNAPSSNITTKINLTDSRWLLWTNGPVLGPAVVYWGELLIFLLFAVLLGRYPFSPLGTSSWLLLGFGLSLYSWSIFIAIVVLFVLLSTVPKYRDVKRRGWFNLSQIMLFLMSLLTLLGLITAIPQSLLGSPDMGIHGYNSYNNNLKWFADQANGQLPQISLLSISVWFYKGIMLQWVLWLSFSLLPWCKWIWQQLGCQGFWQTKPKVIEPENTNDHHSAPEESGIEEKKSDKK